MALRIGSAKSVTQAGMGVAVCVGIGVDVGWGVDVSSGVGVSGIRVSAGVSVGMGTSCVSGAQAEISSAKIAIVLTSISFFIFPPRIGISFRDGALPSK